MKDNGSLSEKITVSNGSTFDEGWLVSGTEGDVEWIDN